MNQMNHAENIPEEFARHLAEQQSQMREADALMHYAHSRTGLLARFLQRIKQLVEKPLRLLG